MPVAAPQPSPSPPNYQSEWVYVTPEVATELLRLNTWNRPLKPWLIDKYAKDYAEGRWQEHHQGIGIDIDNAIVDGQHRLHGIVKSGVSVWMLITRGLDPSTRLVVDDHGRRLISDRLTLSGLGEVSPMRVATLRRMLVGLSADRRQAFRITELALAMRQHAEALNFTEDCFRITQRAVTVAAVRAVVARAFYHAELARLRVFVQVLTSGIMTERSHTAAILLRNNLVMTPQHGHGALTQVAIYAKTERALQAFLSHAELSKLYETQRELFPLPQERALPKRKVQS